MTEATDQEMRVAVERWARARGWWWGRAGTSIQPASQVPWWLVLAADGLVLVRSCSRLVDFDEHNDWGEDGVVDCAVSVHAALIWALVIEAELPPVDMGRCPSPYCEDGRTDSGGVTQYDSPINIPCPDCSGTGREHREVARLLLDAQPTHRGNPAVYVWTKPGDPTSTGALHVLADRLQPDLLRRADGPPRDLDREALGLHLAILLAGKRDGTGEAVEQLIQATGP